MTKQEADKAPWEKAVDQGLEIISLIDDDVPDHAKDAAPDFFEDVRDKVSQVVERIEITRSVSDRQRAALDGWQSGVEAWIK